MSDEKFNLRLTGFEPHTKDPVAALIKAFGVSFEQARGLVNRLPTVVKRNATIEEVRQYSLALERIGATFSVVSAEPDLPSPSPPSVAMGEDGMGILKQTPSSVPSVEPGEAEQQPLENGENSETDSGHYPTAPWVAPWTAPAATFHKKKPREQEQEVAAALGAGQFEEDLEEPVEPVEPVEPIKPDSRPDPLLVLEQTLNANTSPIMSATLDPSHFSHREPEEPKLELDESVLPSGITAGGVPTMPPILAKIEDFESPVWRPLYLNPEVSGSVPAALYTGAEPAVSREFGARATPSQNVSRVTASLTAPRSTASRAEIGPQVKTGAGNGTRGIIIGLVVAAVVIVGLLLVVKLGGGVSSELENLLVSKGQQYIPSLPFVEAEGGSIDSAGRIELVEELRAGNCYGWIATTQDGGLCDLDLQIQRGTTILAADLAVDNEPVVFHCPEGDSSVQLTLSNAGGRGCSYGLARYKGQGSIGWPLEPYLTLYSSYLSAVLSTPYTPVGEVHRGSLSPGASDNTSVTIPAGHCYNFLAISQQGNDLDARLIISGRTVDEDIAVDNYPIVGFCARGESRDAELEIEMYGGVGNYVWQIFEGRPVR